MIDTPHLVEMGQSPVLLGMYEAASTLTTQNDEASTVEQHNGAIDANGSGNAQPTFRRKTSPVKLVERVAVAKLRSSCKESAAHRADSNLYLEWAGGSRYEVGNKPWSILGWMVEGIKNKLKNQ